MLSLTKPKTVSQRILCRIANYRQRSIAQALIPFIRQYPEGGDFQSYQQKQLAKLFKYAVLHCPFYKDLLNELHWRENPLKALQQLPLLSKEIIRRDLKNIVSDQVAHHPYICANTGGSTGEPLELIRSCQTAYVGQLHQRLAFERMRYVNGDKIFTVDGVTVPDESRNAGKFFIESGLGDLPYGRRSYSTLYMSDKNLCHYVRDLRTEKPAFLRGYPSGINWLAEEILKQGDPLLGIKGIQLTSEVAHPWQIENIAKAFQAPIFLQYGHAEAALYAHTWDEGFQYICSPVLGITEILDDNGHAVSVGEQGEVVVTSLHNFVMPFIRYRTGDIAVYGGSNGNVVRLRTLLGRTQDYVVTKDGREVALTGLVFGQHLHAFQNIRKWQLVQTIPGELAVHVVPSAGYGQADEQEIAKTFHDICGLVCRFQVEKEIPASKNGKHRFLLQKIQKKTQE